MLTNLKNGESSQVDPYSINPITLKSIPFFLLFRWSCRLLMLQLFKKSSKQSSNYSTLHFFLFQY